jgi:hypothetical protein
LYHPGQLDKPWIGLKSGGILLLNGASKSPLTIGTWVDWDITVVNIKRFAIAESKVLISKM